MNDPVPAMGAPEHDDWDRHWDDFANAAERNPAQEYRRRRALVLLEKGGTPTRLLDIGSGQGDFLAAASARWPQAELVGTEISARGVEVSKGKVPGAEFHVTDLLAGDKPPADRSSWATHAVCSEVLEHVDDPAALMRNARAWLGSGCRVVVTVPGGPISAFDRHIGHRRHFTASDLAQVLTDAGYLVDRCTGAGFPFFNVYRGVVIVRGDKLVDDVAAEGGESSSGAARLAMAAFRPLFRLNFPSSPLGWQTIGVARVP